MKYTTQCKLCRRPINEGYKNEQNGNKYCSLYCVSLDGDHSDIEKVVYTVFVGDQFTLRQWAIFEAGKVVDIMTDSQTRRAAIEFKAIQIIDLWKHQ